MSVWFYLFLAITFLRQIPQYVLEYKNKNRVVLKDGVYSKTIFCLYMLIWAWSLYKLFFISHFDFFILLGFILLFISILLRMKALWDLGQFYDSQTALFKNHQLVIRGVYKMIRHPLMLALFLELTAMAVCAHALELVPEIVIFIIIGVLRTKAEDRQLSVLFKGEFAAYKRKVGGLWPKM